MVNTRSHDVVVVGGGIIGAATTYFLAKAGVRVRLLERGFLGREASGRNAGTFSLLNDRVADDRPLLLLKRALERWRQLSEELDVNLEVDLDKGTLLVGETQNEFSRLQELKGIYGKIGVSLELLDNSQLRSFANYISPTVHAALYCNLGGMANPRGVASAFGRKAAQLGGVVTEHAEVTRVEPSADGFKVQTSTESIHTGKVVLAQGPWTKAFAERFNVNLPLRIRYFQVSVTDPAHPFIKHGVRRVGGMLTLKQTAQGNCILGGGWQGVSAFPVHGQVNFSTISENCAIASRIVPAFAHRSIIRSWAGYDGSSLDEQPVIDEVPGHEGLFVSTGSSGGFTHGPIFGEMTANMVLGLGNPPDFDRFRLLRFKTA